eukprot:3776770-Amphidinium_carterae.1
MDPLPPPPCSRSWRNSPATCFLSSSTSSLSVSRCTSQLSMAGTGASHAVSMRGRTGHSVGNVSWAFFPAKESS